LVNDENIVSCQIYTVFWAARRLEYVSPFNYMGCGVSYEGGQNLNADMINFDVILGIVN
jgi:hypothetical protein